MTRIFERGALFSVFVLVGSLLGVAVLRPPVGETAAPKAVLEMPRPTVERAEPVKSRFVPLKARGSEALLDGVDIAPDPGHVIQSINSAAVLDRTFTRMGYDLDAIASGESEVPRVFLASMPGDIDKMRETKKRKRLFFKTVLPLVLQVNEEIKQDRKRLDKLIEAKNRGEKIGPVDRLWLIVMAERYKTRRGDLKALLKRVDVIPPSLALAQAAEESGWGTSRFVREGNAMFGQWTTSKAAGTIIPNQRDEGRTHRIKAFDSLLQSVRAYARNLNTHRAYRKLRARRHQLRTQGKPVDGLMLAEQLTSYSERGDGYVKTLRSIIAANKLRPLDLARLNKNPDSRPSI
jgi:Bax protein